MTTGTRVGLGFAAVSLVAWPLAGAYAFGSFTDFETGFTLDQSVDNQGGWSVDNPSFDEEVVDDGTGNIVWRASNAFSSGSFSDQPFAPRPGGEGFNPAVSAVNGLPDEFAGESSTGATFSSFYTEFLFRSVAGPQTGTRLTFSPDDGNGSRMAFAAIEDTGTGINVTNVDYDPGAMAFGATNTIATGLSYTDYHRLGIEIFFVDGTDNDVVNYYVNNALVHTDGTWEEFYRQDAGQAATHPFGVAVQTLLTRISSAGPVDSDGFYIDNVLITQQRPVSPTS